MSPPESEQEQENSIMEQRTLQPYTTATALSHPMDLEALAMAPFPTLAADASAADGQPLSLRTTNAAIPQPPLPVTRYSIEALRNGFFVCNLPPLHELHVHTPTLCEVVKAEAGPTVPLLKLEDPDADQEQLAAPFVFRVGLTGFITALRLPLGTETTILFVDEEEEGAAEQESTVETSFETVDNYRVTFLTRLSS